jgi:leucyl/phenylalanyl-tRNA--protein transferase
LAVSLFAAGYVLIDCQLPTSHLQSLGGESVSRRDFLRSLRTSGIKPSTRPVAGKFPRGELEVTVLLVGQWRSCGGG